eukprot:1217447-Prymnesium_polylepis.1
MRPKSAVHKYNRTARSRGLLTCRERGGIDGYLLPSHNRRRARALATSHTERKSHGRWPMMSPGA